MEQYVNNKSILSAYFANLCQGCSRCSAGSPSAMQAFGRIAVGEAGSGHPVRSNISTNIDNFNIILESTVYSIETCH